MNHGPATGAAADPATDPGGDPIADRAADPAAVAGLAADDLPDGRRFGGVARLFGDRGLAVLQAAHVVVVGIGGVGSWSAEALARSAVGRLTLIDLDHVSVSNVNRQILALESTIGAAKGAVMAARIRDIAPDCRVDVVDEFVSADNVAQILPGAPALVIDAIDQASAKAAMIAHCVSAGQPVVVCGAAGGRIDPLRLARGDLAHTTGDALLASVRARLRRHHGFSRDARRRFGVTALYSDEPPGSSAALAPDPAAGMPLACAGYGSFVAVTAAMGMAAAQVAISLLLSGRTTLPAPRG